MLGLKLNHISKRVHWSKTNIMINLYSMISAIEECPQNRSFKGVQVFRNIFLGIPNGVSVNNYPRGKFCVRGIKYVMIEKIQDTGLLLMKIIPRIASTNIAVTHYRQHRNQCLAIQLASLSHVQDNSELYCAYLHWFFFIFTSIHLAIHIMMKITREIGKIMFPMQEGHIHDLKNTERHTAHTIVSWPNPKQWVIVHTSDLMMIIRQSIYILSIITREMGKLKTHSPKNISIKLHWESVYQK